MKICHDCLADIANKLHVLFLRHELVGKDLQDMKKLLDDCIMRVTDSGRLKYHTPDEDNP